jgi:hypothetical protein
MPSLLHTIRLAGPWEFRIGDEGDWTTVKLPMEWCGIFEALEVGDTTTDPAHFRGAKGDFAARRRFQRPTGLEGEKVWIVVPRGGPAVCKFAINDVEAPIVMLAHEGGQVFAVTDLLRPSNVVSIEFDSERLMEHDAPGSTFHGVLLEIRAASDKSA